MDGEAQVLEVDSDLVRAASQGKTPDNAGFPVKAEPLKDGPALLSFWVNSAQADFKRNNKDGLLADQLALWKFPLNSAHVLFFKLFRSKEGKNNYKKSYNEGISDQKSLFHPFNPD